MIQMVVQALGKMFRGTGIRGNDRPCGHVQGCGRVAPHGILPPFGPGSAMISTNLGLFNLIPPAGAGRRLAFVPPSLRGVRGKPLKPEQQGLSAACGHSVAFGPYSTGYLPGFSEVEAVLRRKTKIVQAGTLAIGGGAPVSVQSMTTTDTRNWQETVRQIKALADAGCELVRVAVPDFEAVAACRRSALPRLFLWQQISTLTGGWLWKP